MARFMYAVLFVTCPLFAHAQYTFTANIRYFGSCKGDKDPEWRAWMQEIEAMSVQMSWPTKQACEQQRRQIDGRSDSYTHTWKGHVYTCGAKVVTTPCTGRSPMGSGTANPYGVERGSSFYSVNPANENQDWSNDEIERRLALNGLQEENVDAPLTSDADFNDALEIDFSKPFVSLDLRRGGSNKFGPQEIYDFIDKGVLDQIHSDYLKEANIDILSIFLKEDKSEDDLAKIQDYLKWYEKQIDNAEKEKDASIISAIEYEDANLDLLQYTDYRLVTLDQIPEDHPMYRLMKLLDSCNSDPMNEGFHAGLYMKPGTNEYVLGFRGTEFPDGMLSDIGKMLAKRIVTEPGKSLTTHISEMIKDLTEGRLESFPDSWKTDVATDAGQAIGRVMTQYKMAAELGDVIKQIKEEYPDMSIRITGHSMGGGEGILAGAVSGQPTYVFNPAGVHPNTYEWAEVSGNVFRDNIKVISTRDDQLTNLQEGNGKGYALLNAGIKVLAGVHASQSGKDKESATRHGMQALPTAMGEKKVIVTNGGHSIEPIADLCIKRDYMLKRIRTMDESDLAPRIYLNE